MIIIVVIYHNLYCYHTHSLSLPLTQPYPLPFSLPLLQAVEKSVKITQANYERTVSKVRTYTPIFPYYDSSVTLYMSIIIIIKNVEFNSTSQNAYCLITEHKFYYSYTLTIITSAT
jgi:hypothetical protein